MLVFLVSGFLYGKMGSAISTNASERAAVISRVSLELMSSSRCHMRSTAMVKGEIFAT